MATVLGLNHLNQKQLRQAARNLNVPIINNGVSRASILAAILAK